MIKRYSLYIVNQKSGSSRDIVLNANSSYNARIYGEDCLRNEYEKIICVYPYTPSERFERD